MPEQQLASPVALGLAAESEKEGGEWVCNKLKHVCCIESALNTVDL
jgi:hypothetical protein